MTAREILSALEKDGLGDGLSLFEGPVDPAIVVPAASLRAVCERLKTASQLQFEQLVLVTGTHRIEKRDKAGEVEREEGFEVMYHLRSLKHHACLALKVQLPAEAPSVDSVADLWAAANWHERETYDLVGITFDGHPDLKRILLPEDWEGHPLRKDYVFPREYRGISLEVDPPWPAA